MRRQEQLVETKNQRDRYNKQLEERIKAAIMPGKNVQVDALWRWSGALINSNTSRIVFLIRRDCSSA